MIPNLKPEMAELIQNISQKNMYSGNKISESIMRQFEIEEKEYSIGILVPFWLSVTERGRGPRRSSKDYGLWKIIYRWMERRNLFRSGIAKVRIREAKFITWYINKYGNKQFRNKIFVDIYTTERKNIIEKIDKKFGDYISKITMEVL